MDTLTKIKITINTLNQVAVSGKKNLDYLLGSIQLLEQVIREQEEMSHGEQEGQN